MSTPSEPTGALLPVGALFSATFDDLTKNLMGYVLGGLGLFLMLMPLGFIVAFGGIFGMNIVAVVGSIASAVVGESMGDRDLAAVVTLLGTFGSLAVGFFLFMAAIAVVSAIGAPFSASLQRAIAAHQRGQGELAIGSAFATPMQGAVSAIGVTLFVTGATLFGIGFCYVGALVPAFFFSFAAPMVAIHGVGAIEALRRTARHAMAHPSDHALYTLVWLGTAMVAGQIPVLGYAFLMALNVRAYRMLFGDGAEPAV